MSSMEGMGFSPAPPGYHSVPIVVNGQTIGVSFEPDGPGQVSSGPAASAPSGLGQSGPAPMTPYQTDAVARLQQVLGDYGLGSLSDWVWRQVTEGRSEAEVLQSLRETPEFKTRFKAIEERKRLGLPAISPADVLNYEQQVRSMMRAANMPVGFYDSPDDYVAFLVADVSPQELDARIGQAYTRVSMAPTAVRTAFTELWGPDGAAALASFVLDPDRSVATLQNGLAQAEILGYGRGFGFNFNRAQLESLASYGVAGDTAQRGLAQLSQNKALFTETVSETNDITAEQEGAEAVFGLGPGGEVIEKRRQQRTAAFSGRGGAATTRTGLAIGAAGEG